MFDLFSEWPLIELGESFFVNNVEYCGSTYLVEIRKNEFRPDGSNFCRADYGRSADAQWRSLIRAYGSTELQALSCRHRLFEQFQKAYAQMAKIN
jgi:hypothetical protein